MFDKLIYVGGELRYLLRKRNEIANPEQTVINLFEKSFHLMGLEEGVNSGVFNNVVGRLYNIREKYDSYSMVHNLIADLSLVSFELSKLERSDRYREQVREFRYELADLYCHLQNGRSLR